MKIMIAPLDSNSWSFALGTFNTYQEANAWAIKTIQVGYQWMVVEVHSDGDGIIPQPQPKLGPCYCDSAYHPQGC